MPTVTRLVVATKPSPWPARAAYLAALHEASGQVLQSLLELMPNDRFLLRSFRASRIFRDHHDEIDTADRERYGMARAEWLARLVTWGAAWHLPAWAVESAEETLEVRRLLLLYGVPEPVPTSWTLAQAAEPQLPPGVSHQELVQLARYQHLRTSVSQLAWAARMDRKGMRTLLRGTAAAIGVQLRAPSRGGRPRRSEPDQLTLLPAALKALPVKGTVR